MLLSTLLNMIFYPLSAIVKKCENLWGGGGGILQNVEITFFFPHKWYLDEVKLYSLGYGITFYLIRDSRKAPQHYIFKSKKDTILN